MIIFYLLLALMMLSPSTSASAQGRREQSERTRTRQSKKREREKGNKLENLPAAFTMIWQFASESTTRFPALPENEAVYLPLNDGRIIALDAKSGDLRWETQPGGVIVAPLVAAPDLIFIASRQGTAESAQGGGILRALNKRSGLALWTREFPQPFCAPLVIDEQAIYTTSEDQNFYALNRETGAVLWSAPLGSVARGRPLITEEEIFIGTEAGAMFLLSRANGKPLWQFQASGAVRGAAAVDERSAYFGDSEGYVYCVERRSGKLRWRIRTGAAIESAPLVAGKLLLVASFDNFIYGLEARSGDRVWKLRFQGRLSFDPVLDGENMIVTPLAGNQLFMLSTAGRVLGQFRINSGEIIAPPVLQDTRLFIVTDEGLIAATAKEIEPIKKESSKAGK